MLNVSITGASGYIGSKLVNVLENLNCNVISFIKNNHLLNHRNSYLFDILNENDIEKLVIKSDVIYFLAGNTSLYFARDNEDESYRLTVRPIEKLIAFSRKHNKKIKLIYASTATVYGNQNQLPVRETVIPNPISIYDKHKLISEKKIEEAIKNDFLEGCILRFANIYGPSINQVSSSDRGVLNKICLQAIKNNKIIVYGNGNYIRDYIYIDDVINALIKIGFSKKINERIYNICSNTGIKISDVFTRAITKANNIFNYNNKISYQEWPIEVEEIEKRNFIGCNERIKREFKWIPKVGIDEGIDKTLRFFSTNIS